MRSATPLIMLICVLGFGIQANGQDTVLDKRISPAFRDITIKEALRELEIASGITFAFDTNISGLLIRRNGDFRNRTLREVLDYLLQETGLSYKVSGAQIIIFETDPQGRGRIRGKIVDEDTGRPVQYVSVTLAGTTNGTTSNSQGEFVLDGLVESTYNLVLSCVGYQRATLNDIHVTGGQEQMLGPLHLEEEVISLREVVVSPGSFEVMGTAPLSRQTLSERDLKNMSFAEDITRVVARLPGISSTDYSSKFTIRGGEEDEVLINLDGMELYEPFHQRDFSGGLFSIVDIETIQGIELLTGGFAAEYGNRLSGVFNMKTKHISEGQSHESIGLSAMNGRFYADGKAFGGNGSYIVSARRSMLDLLFKAVDETENLPSFYDGTIKLEYELSPKYTLSFHVLQAWDKLKVTDIAEDGNFDKDQTKYHNTYAWFTLNSAYNPKLSSQTLAYSGQVSHDRVGTFHKYEPSDKGDFSLGDKRDYTFFGLKQNWTYTPADKLNIDAGFDLRLEHANFNYMMGLSELRVDSTETIYNYSQNTNIDHQVTGSMASAHLSLRYQLLPKMILEHGWRFDHVSYTGDNLASPRFGLAYMFNKKTFLRAAWGYYYQSQFMNNLEVNDGVTQFNPAELATHYVLGFEHLFPNGINFRLETYYKDMSRLSPRYQNMRDHLEIFPEQRNDYVKVEYDGARAKGVELFIKYDNGGKFTYWFSYALARAEDNVKRVVYDGLLIKRTGWAPRLNEQRHTIYADVNYRPNDKWTFNLSWNYYVGWPRTDYTYRYQILANGDYHFYPVHKEFNATIYPAYHRMDVRANRVFVLNNKGKVTTFVHLINVYNHKNLKKFDLDCTRDDGQYSIDTNGNYVPVRDDTYWFGFIPVIGASWEF